MLSTDTDTTPDIRTFPRLRAGDDGEWVAYLQRALAFHQAPGLPETGTFDRPTAAALAAFQARLDLDLAGAHEVDAETWWHLTSTTCTLPTNPEPAGAVVVLTLAIAA